MTWPLDVPKKKKKKEFLLKGQSVNLFSELPSKESTNQKKFKPYKNHHGYKKKVKKSDGPKTNLKKDHKCKISDFLKGKRDFYTF